MTKGKKTQVAQATGTGIFTKKRMDTIIKSTMEEDDDQVSVKIQEEQNDGLNQDLRDSHITLQEGDGTIKADKESGMIGFSQEASLKLTKLNQF